MFNAKNKELTHEITPPYSPLLMGLQRGKLEHKAMMNDVLVSSNSPTNSEVKLFCLHLHYKIKFLIRKVVRHLMGYEKVTLLV